MLETQIQTSRDYGREGGDRLSEAWETIKDQLQKGIDKVTGNKGNEVQEAIDETADALNTFISPNQEP